MLGEGGLLILYTKLQITAWHFAAQKEAHGLHCSLYLNVLITITSPPPPKKIKLKKNWPENFNYYMHWLKLSHECFSMPGLDELASVFLEKKIFKDFVTGFSLSRFVEKTGSSFDKHFFLPLPPPSANKAQTSTYPDSILCCKLINVGCAPYPRKRKERKCRQTPFS